MTVDSVPASPPCLHARTVAASASMDRTVLRRSCRGPPGPAILLRMADAEELSALAHRHLWMHFSRLGGYSADAPVHVIARGEGCSLWDATGHRLLDGLSGLFTVQVGHGRRDLADAARAQAETLDYFPLWTYAHPP